MADSSRTEEFSVCSQTTSSGNKYGGLMPKKKPLISKTGLYASKVQVLIKNQPWLLKHCVPNCREQIISNCLLEDLLVHLDSYVEPLPLQNADFVMFFAG
ncbi:uncharacterized protein LOC107878678 isoform X1 [Capsicum annuum]|uniref:uncharacterized protein LOC107878678 isoform X1 n=1 Tax=Capsicum annuum TaxID=4072 RepID=UPI0007BFD7CF|nr:uncharacterized protein LOC107878678 isoform X1 [Capsicum annuum]XP_016581256.1 uncharacterized protein LOC107878678 isoform X1 [Capsicum annuum]XP_047263225.1 uncharacterized protein LOC107878678 isoform X1 [Capsicum annuum]